MCVDCGCSDGAQAKATTLATGKVVELRATHADHDHDHDHEGHHERGHSHAHPSNAHDHHHHDHAHPHELVHLGRAVLEKNDRLAERNRAWLEGREVLMLNLVSSPGSGKTSLLERTIREFGGTTPISVIEGDQATINDSRRIAAAGAPTVQVNTGTGCHLEADMIRHGLDELKPKPGSVVFVENVGNLVCPALFDLGEAAKVAILSVTEGEDKPLKYPHMFRAARLVLLNKIDLLPHLDFNISKALEHARTVNPEVEIIQVSARSGEGMAEWYDWLAARLPRPS